MLVRQTELAKAKELMGDAVEFVVTTLDDLWMRDTEIALSLSTTHRGGMACIDFHFNGWGDKQSHEEDAKVAAFIAQETGLDVLATDLVLEGGGIEVDGQGTAIITESCVLNSNRNPNVSKEQCEAELKELLWLQKIIWVPGIAGKDITDGHTDFYTRFVRPGWWWLAMTLTRLPLTMLSPKNISKSSKLPQMPRDARWKWSSSKRLRPFALILKAIPLPLATSTFMCAMVG